ncbi:MAG: DUF3617 domain-containing protein [Betaproteobacteria bacterium]|nr:MAG: DUF3617 domain-containing protein [Betaproteobacteria bacterium]
MPRHPHNPSTGAAMRLSLTLRILALACLGLPAAPAAAQTMKPGLWEITNKMGGDQGAKMAAAQEQMQKQLAAMPPEQRKQMEKMMAQQGVGMAPQAGGGMASRICISKEMAARNEAPAQQGDCKQDILQRSGNTTRFKFICSKPPSSGEGEVTLLSPEAYTMKMKMTSHAKGKPEQMTMEAQGKWLSNDCGNLKPVKG